MRAKFLGVISYRRNTRLRMSILLMGADMICFLLAGLLAIVVRPIFNTPLRFELFQQTLPILIISLISFGFNGLYPAIGISPVEELRKLVSTTTLVVLILTAVSFWTRNAEAFSRIDPNSNLVV